MRPGYEKRGRMRVAGMGILVPGLLAVVWIPYVWRHHDAVCSGGLMDLVAGYADIGAGMLIMATVAVGFAVITVFSSGL